MIEFIHMTLGFFAGLILYCITEKIIDDIKKQKERNRIREMQGTGDSSSVIINVPSNYKSMHCVSDGKRCQCIDNKGNVTHYLQNEDGTLNQIEVLEYENTITYSNEPIISEGGAGGYGKPSYKIITEFPKD